MKTHHLALLSAFVPFAAIISGCGGGNGVVPQATPLPAPTFIAPPTGSSVLPSVTVARSPLMLPGGQIALLKLTRNGGLAQGTLQVFNGQASDTTLAPNNYLVSGAFSAPTAFSVSNQGIGANKFTISGNVPRDNNSDGDYRFTLRKSNGGGVLLAPNTGVVGPQDGIIGVLNSVLQFSDFTPTGTNNFNPPFSVSTIGGGGFDGQGVNPASVGAYTYRIRGNQFFPSFRAVAVRELSDRSQPLTLEFQLNSVRPNQTSFSPGKIFSFAPGADNEGIAASLRITYEGRSYVSDSGTATISSLTAFDPSNNRTRTNPAEAITFRLNNVRMVFPESGNAQSSFTTNGDFVVFGQSTIYDVQ